MVVVWTAPVWTVGWQPAIGHHVVIDMTVSVSSSLSLWLHEVPTHVLARKRVGLCTCVSGRVEVESQDRRFS